MVVPLANAGDSVPLLSVSAESRASAEVLRCTVIIYDFVDTPSCAVTTVVSVVAPKFSEKTGGELLPDAIGVPFTVIVAVESIVLADTAIEVVDELTDAL